MKQSRTYDVESDQLTKHQTTVQSKVRGSLWYGSNGEKARKLFPHPVLKVSIDIRKSGLHPKVPAVKFRANLQANHLVLHMDIVLKR
jgi:hypothetical protein